MSIRTSLAQVAVLCAAFTVPAAVAQPAVARPTADFRPIPGERALSGRLIARPIQPDDARDRRVSAASAAGNPAFKVRFRVSANRSDEWGDVDSVVVSGTPTG